MTEEFSISDLLTKCSECKGNFIKLYVYESFGLTKWLCESCYIKEKEK